MTRDSEAQLGMSTQPIDEQQQRGPTSEEIDDLPPSAKLVLQSLHRTDGLTTRQIAAEVDLAERTIRYALNQLRGMDIIESRYLLSDPQTCKYILTVEDQRLVELSDR